MQGQQRRKGQTNGSRLGRGSIHEKNLHTVLDLFLDLAGDNSNIVWQKIESKLNPNQCQDLKKALIVRWDANQQLLVTSVRRDPARQEDAFINGNTSNKSTKEAIRLCLRGNNGSLKNKLDQNGQLTTKQESDQIRNVLYLLKRLNIYKENTPKKQIDSTKRSNNGFLSFWIDFSSSSSKSKTDCHNLVSKLMNNARKENKTDQRNQYIANEDDEEDERKAELDLWVYTHLKSWRARFEDLDDVKDRRIHVDLKAEIKLAATSIKANSGNPVRRIPSPEDLKAIVAEKGSQMILIWEEGGAGKTSLAFQIARWGLDGQLAEHYLLPILVDPAIGNGDVVDRVYEQLKHLDDPKLTLDFVRDLLRYRRLLPIIDHVSELTDDHRKWLSRELQPTLVLLTSRLRENNLFRGWSITEIKPIRLEGEALFDFFENYMDAIGKQDFDKSVFVVLTTDDQIHMRGMLERMVGNKPITVLLAWLVINTTINIIIEGRRETLPFSVPDLMRQYVDRCGRTIPPENLKLADGTQLQPGWILASLKVLALAAHSQNDSYRPQNFELQLALASLKKVTWVGQELASELQQRNLLLFLHEKLNLLQRRGGDDRNPIYRLALDPLADYMAALALMEELSQEQETPTLYERDHYQRVQDWLDLLECRLEREDGDSGLLMRGFMAACRDCYKEHLTRASFYLEPSLRQKWELIPHTFARLAGIDPQEERKLEARHLIRRHADDLFWSNPELLPKAIAELTAFAQEFEGGRKLDIAVRPLALTLAKATLPEGVRTAAAEALGRIGGEEAAKSLVRMIKNANEPSVAVRRAAAEALGLIKLNTKNHWDMLVEILTSKVFNGESDQRRVQAMLPLLQGASRGLQRLANRALPSWGSGPGHQVPMLSLTTDAGAVTTTVVTRPVWQLPLPEDIPLEIVVIEEGTWTIGSPPGEEGLEAYDHRRETKGIDVEAIRLVKAPTFAIARFPITQAQWKTLAGQSHRRGHDVRELKLEPAQTKGADLPVECVNWWDAKEWCARLQQHLQSIGSQVLRVELPSESLWEVACRAGTRSPFHFGDTIDSAWANYDGTYVHGPGKQGVFLNRISSVGSYGLVNAWGLGDMHGNVWEWCADIWHPSPSDIPENGKAREKPLQDLNESRIRRGGSWTYGPRCCRASFRSSHPPNYVSNKNGFRPCFFFNTN